MGVQLVDLVRTSEAVSDTGGRLEKVERLARLLGRLERPEIPIAVAYLSGELPHDPIGVGPATLADAWPEGGAEQSSLGLLETDAALRAIGTVSGAGSGAEKTRRLRELLAVATPEERGFLARLLTGELRQGAQGGLMLEAVARAASAPPGAVRRAVMLSGDPGAVARAVLERGPEALAEFSIRLFRPVKPMLAQTADGIDDALDRLGSAVLETKLDGARIQVHKAGDEVRIYTRRLNDETEALPELVEAARVLPISELVLDGEAIALRPDGRPRRFQDTMRRFGRVKDIDALRAKLPLTPFLFDCLLLEGEPLLDLPGSERWAALDRALPERLRVERLTPGAAEEARAFLGRALEAGHEGVLAKDPAAPYVAGRRGAAWLKVKPAWTLDLVVLAAEWGHGRRRGWLSNLHLGARDVESGGFAMVGKTFKGMTDELLAWQTMRLQQLAQERRDWGVRVRPELVVEVAIDGVQRSPRYPAGLALRFARVKGYRPDKSPSEADTVATLRAIYEGRAGLPGALG